MNQTQYSIESAALIFQSSQSRVYKSENADGPVVLKILNSEYPTDYEISRIDNEFLLLKDISVPGIRKSIEKAQMDGRLALVLEYCDGEMLDLFLSKNKLHQAQKIDLMVQILAPLIALHNLDILHLDLSLQNILVSNSGKNCTIIDFENAVKLGQNDEQLQQNNNARGFSLSFMSPEQSGRINRRIDKRADLYSLGVVFYYLLTERLPFIGKDTAEIVHAHLAVQAASLTQLQSDIPPLLNDMVMTLLNKDPDDRYQSLDAFLRDLIQFKTEFENGNSNPQFALSKDYTRASIRFPSKTLFRQNEKNILSNAYLNTIGNGKTLLAVQGDSGVGTTTLLHSFGNFVNAEKAVYLYGKFDQKNSDKIYSPFGQMIHYWLQQIYTFSEAELDMIRNKFKERMGPAAKLLTAVSEEISIITGLPDPEDAQDKGNFTIRLNLVLIDFIKILAEDKKAIVLCIDNIQWADRASLILLENLFMAAGLDNLMLIVAGRTMDLMPETLENKIFDTIKLAGFTLPQIEEYLFQSFYPKFMDFEKLANILFNKCDGNPQLIKEWVILLKEKRALYFGEDKKWELDNIKLENLVVTDKTAGIIKTRIESLDIYWKELLISASFLGLRFSLDKLVLGTGRELDEVVAILQNCIQKGFVVSVKKRLDFLKISEKPDLNQYEFEFVHQSIWEVFYNQLTGADKAWRHWLMAQSFLKTADWKSLNDDLLVEVANQSSQASSVITSPEEIETMMLISSKASAVLKRKSAFSQALFLADHAIKLCPENQWNSDYELTLSLYNNGIELATLSPDFDAFNRYGAILDSKFKSETDRITLLKARVLFPAKPGSKVDHLKEAFEILNLLGVKMPEKPSKFAAILNIIQLSNKLTGEKGRKRILDLPKMEDEKAIAAMDIMAHIGPWVFDLKPDLLADLIFHLINTSLKYGICSQSPVAFLGFGVIQEAFLNSVKKGIAIGDTCKILMDSKQLFVEKTKFITTYGIYIHHWKNGWKDSAAYLLEGFETRSDTGDLFNASLGYLIYIPTAFFAGIPLQSIENNWNLESGNLLDMKQYSPYYKASIFYQLAYHYFRPNENQEQYDGSFMNVALFNDKFPKDLNDLPANGYFDFCNFIYFYHLAENMEKANHFLNLTKQNPLAFPGTIIYLSFVFYESLFLLDYERINGNTKGKKTILKHIKTLKKWSDLQPINHKHRYELALACFAEDTGNTADTIELFNTAINSARLAQNIFDEALALEKATSFLMRNNMTVAAEGYAVRTLKAYTKWGAVNKVKKLQSKYHDILISSEASASNSYKPSLKESGQQENVDLLALAKASKAIASEIVLSNMVKRLMAVVIENAGATKGYFLLHKNENWFVEAEAGTADNGYFKYHNMPLAGNSVLPENLANYAIRSKEVLLVNNMQEDAGWLAPYREDNPNVQSLMILPVADRGNVIGIIWLENELIKGAFMHERSRILQLLTGQIAVSLNNSLLFETLELKVEERTRAINAQKNEIEFQRQLIETEKLRSDDLLRNILPAETAEELKTTGKSAPRFHPNAIIMFSDIKSFTHIAEQMGPTELVEEIDACFSAFDAIIGKHGLEKIKTIGDAYMCAAGVPHEGKGSAKKMVLASLEILEFIKGHRFKNKNIDTPGFQIRIGIHAGPAVSGVVGKIKFAYDIWGDTVNIASRMETAAEVGTINMSKAMHGLIKDDFKCVARGNYHVKNKGEMEMFAILPNSF